MKKLFLATTLLVAGVVGYATTAHASDPVNADRSGLYVGGYLGAPTDSQGRINVGTDIGFQVGPHVRLEADYDHMWFNTTTGDAVSAQAIAQYRIPNSTVTPYVIAGAGMAFSNGSDVGLYDVGTGVRVAVSQSVEADFRYRFVAPMHQNNTVNNRQNVFTAGLNYRF